LPGGTRLESRGRALASAATASSLRRESPNYCCFSFFRKLTDFPAPLLFWCRTTRRKGGPISLRDSERARKGGTGVWVRPQHQRDHNSARHPPPVGASGAGQCFRASSVGRKIFAKAPAIGGERCQQMAGGLGLSPPAHLHLSTTLLPFFSFAVSPSLFQMYAPLSCRDVCSRQSRCLCVGCHFASGFFSLKSPK
jgi:hypothetical protein